MTLQKCDASLVLDAKRSSENWCVFEHQVMMQADEPPQVILVGACRLLEVFKLTDGRGNSDWTEIFKNGGSVLVRILAITYDRQEAFREAARLARDMDPRPRCNLVGYNLRGKSRAVVCLNNGERYVTQTEAAEKLGIHGSAISRHLKGDLSHAQGFKFAYATERL